MTILPEGEGVHMTMAERHLQEILGDVMLCSEKSHACSIAKRGCAKE
jgi:hypothetical protein